MAHFRQARGLLIPLSAANIFMIQICLKNTRAAISESELGLGKS